MKLKCVIIDDEPKGAKSLEIILHKCCPEIEVEGNAHNALDGITLVKKINPDIIFLDIQMPVHSGFDVLEHINRDHSFIVFVTAHEQYTLQALKKQVFDYLLKPVDPEELKSCVQRIQACIEKKEPGIENRKAKRESITKEKLSIPVKEGFLYLKQEEIVRIEGSGSYSYIFMTNKEKHLVSKSLKELEDQLDPHVFYRCHNSHIVNISMVKKFVREDGFFVHLADGSVVEVSRTKKDEFVSMLA